MTSNGGEFLLDRSPSVKQESFDASAGLRDQQTSISAPSSVDIQQMRMQNIYQRSGTQRQLYDQQRVEFARLQQQHTDLIGIDPAVGPPDILQYQARAAKLTNVPQEADLPPAKRPKLDVKEDSPPLPTVTSPGGEPKVHKLFTILPEFIDKNGSIIGSKIKKFLSAMKIFVASTAKDKFLHPILNTQTPKTLERFVELDGMDTIQSWLMELSLSPTDATDIFKVILHLPIHEMKSGKAAHMISVIQLLQKTMHDRPDVVSTSHLAEAKLKKQQEEEEKKEREASEKAEKEKVEREKEEKERLERKKEKAEKKAKLGEAGTSEKKKENKRKAAAAAAIPPPSSFEEVLTGEVKTQSIGTPTRKMNDPLAGKRHKLQLLTTTTSEESNTGKKKVAAVVSKKPISADEIKKARRNMPDAKTDSKPSPPAPQDKPPLLIGEKKTVVDENKTSPPTSPTILNRPRTNSMKKVVQPLDDVDVWSVGGPKLQADQVEQNPLDYQDSEAPGMSKRTGRMKKRVSWPVDDNMCQIKLFSKDKEEVPNAAEIEKDLGDFSKEERKHMHVSEEGRHRDSTTIIPYYKPIRTDINPSLIFQRGRDSQQIAVQRAREEKELSPSYWIFSGTIPNDPEDITNEEPDYDDSRTNIIPHGEGNQGQPPIYNPPPVQNFGPVNVPMIPQNLPMVNPVAALPNDQLFGLLSVLNNTGLIPNTNAIPPAQDLNFLGNIIPSVTNQNNMLPNAGYPGPNYNPPNMNPPYNPPSMSPPYNQPSMSPPYHQSSPPHTPYYGNNMNNMSPGRHSPMASQGSMNNYGSNQPYNNNNNYNSGNNYRDNRYLNYSPPSQNYGGNYNSGQRSPPRNNDNYGDRDRDNYGRDGNRYNNNHNNGRQNNNGPPNGGHRGKKMCLYYKSPQGCRSGSKCEFIHDNNAPPPNNRR
ncbi:hypothetical protein PROFUN_01693 [Planoprotostelium fungivorum]|uniref:C3H1-type domain-containing protein n=1 Tax=Planoprotostelium fungivorum TaxID=1890364 RepID=A0A2P6MWA1_9EUKA|nr:hypothetical protein PROFUN_01693 [Planoprotostelium fungivorum]